MDPSSIIRMSTAMYMKDRHDRTFYDLWIASSASEYYATHMLQNTMLRAIGLEKTRRDVMDKIQGILVMI